MAWQNFVTQIDDGKRELARLLEGVTPTQFNRRPAPGVWSLGECLRHVLLTNETALGAMARMTKELKSKGLRAAGPYRPSLLGSIVLWSIEPPYRVRVPAVRSLQPAQTNEEMGALVGEYLAMQDRLLEAYRNAEGLDLSKVSERLPTGFRFQLGEWFQMVTAHQRRHMFQMRRIKERLG